MKVLWLVNIVMPELAAHLGRRSTVFGGWLSGAEKAVKESSYDLVICAAEDGRTKTEKYQMEGVTYYLTGRSSFACMQKEFQTILAEEAPDVVHIYGTEFEQSWAMASVCEKDKLLVTIQGLAGACAEHIYGGIPESEARDTWMHKLLRKTGKGGNSIENKKEDFLRRKESEDNVLKKAVYINGGSRWAEGYASMRNPDAKFLNCQLILRDSFYCEDRWSYDDCEKHSITIINSYPNPIKGFDVFLEALNLLKELVPDVKVYAVGPHFRYRNYQGLNRFVMDHAPDYEWLIQKRIERYGLKDHIRFIKKRDEAGMKKLYLQSHVFVSASSIENQSTSLGEAMILGVPCVASCVGGVQDMMDHQKDGFLYPFDEPYMLAYGILQIFRSRELAERFSENGHIRASKTYDRNKNCKDLICMYDTIAGNQQQGGSNL